MYKSFLMMLLLMMSTPMLFSQDWQEVWSDEFSGDRIDENKWEFMIGDGTAYGLQSGWGNNERQYYRRENAVVQDGFLTIIAKQESYGGKQYTSARLRTKNRGDWTYGRFEMRAKMPVGRGIWPAFWMMPTKEKYGGWAASGEIDMVEYLGHEPKTIYGTLHYGGSWPNNVSKGKSYTLRNGAFADDFHLFVFEWEYGKTRWYVDGLLYHQDSNWWSSGGSFPAPFDQDFHMLLNVAVGGNWPGYPDGTTLFPQQMVVDYIRVFQKNVQVDAKTDELPASGQRLSAHPNPFNAVAALSYQVQEQGWVRLEVMNVRGQLIETLVNDVRTPGLYTLSYDASSLPAGIFLLCLSAEGQRDQIRLVSVK